MTESRSSFFTEQNVPSDEGALSILARSALIGRSPTAFRQSTPFNLASHRELEGMSLADKIAVIHERMMPRVQATGIFTFAESKDIGDLKADIREEVVALMGGIDEFRAFHQLPSNARTLSEIAQAYASVDVYGYNDCNQLIAVRRRQRSGMRVVLDVDNTVTDHSKLDKKGPVDPLLLGSALADPLHGPNREYFPHAFASIWGPLLRAYPEVFEEGGRAAPLREGMDDLIRELLSRGIDVTFLSTNFYPFVRGVSSRLPLGDRIRHRTIVTGSITASAKADMLRDLALQDPTKAIFYIGDGTSDLPTLKAKGIIAGFSALADSIYDRQLQSEGIPHFTYRTGYDIARQLLPLI